MADVVDMTLRYGRCTVTFLQERKKGKVGQILGGTNYYPFGLTMAGISSKAAGGVENTYKYNGKELQTKEFSDCSGLEWEAYGARMYDIQLSRFFNQDRFVENFYMLSPYNYCANNPISNIDINGDIIADPQGAISKYENALKAREATIDKILNDETIDWNALGKGGLTRELAEKVRNQVHDIIIGITELRKSDDIYSVILSEGNNHKGTTGVNLSNGHIEMTFSKEASLEIIGHEITHCIQYERGQISFARDERKVGSLLDINDETNAYNNGRIVEGAININIIVDDEWSRSQDPAYKALPIGPININSKEGKKLKRKTTLEAKAGIPNSEFYKGWQKDYKK